MGNLLLVDLSNIVHRALHANTLSFAGKFTGGVFGVLKMLSKQINDLRITDVIICRDSKPYDREVDFPGYKGDRPKRDDDPDHEKKMRDSFRLVKELIEVLGVRVIKKKGAEADDLVALMVSRYSSEYKSIYLMSNDSDLYQLFEYPNVFMIKKAGLYGRAEFREEFKVKPRDWPWVTALAGSHNGVPGIKGVGPKTAVKVVTAAKCMEDIINYKDGEYSELLQRNHELATLPYKEYKVRMPLPGKFSERKLVKFSATLGIAIPGYVASAFKKVSHS